MVVFESFRMCSGFWAAGLCTYSSADAPRESTRALWQQFRPLLPQLENRVGTNLLSIQVFPDDMDFARVLPSVRFTKWAAAEVAAPPPEPLGLQCLWVPPGCYAAFRYQGLPQGAMEAMRFIFEEFLPLTEYLPDHRPFVDRMPFDYRPNDPLATETILVPVRKIESNSRQSST